MNLAASGSMSQGLKMSNAIQEHVAHLKGQRIDTQQVSAVGVSRPAHVGEKWGSRPLVLDHTMLDHTMSHKTTKIAFIAGLETDRSGDCRMLTAV